MSASSFVVILSTCDIHACRSCTPCAALRYGGACPSARPHVCACERASVHACVCAVACRVCVSLPVVPWHCAAWVAVAGRRSRPIRPSVHPFVPSVVRPSDPGIVRPSHPIRPIRPSHLSIRPSVPPVCPSVDPSVRPSACPPAHAPPSGPPTFGRPRPMNTAPMIPVLAFSLPLPPKEEETEERKQAV